jgi:hypothetical protein
MGPTWPKSRVYINSVDDSETVEWDVHVDASADASEEAGVESSSGKEDGKSSSRRWKHWNKEDRS